MKLIKKILYTIIIILMLPTIVNADSAGPVSSNYTVTVANQEGTILYDWEMTKTLTIPYNEKLTVYFEYEKEDGLYGDVYYKDKYGYIKLSDTIANPDDIDFSELYENTYKEQYYTLKETKMYKGPSIVYGEIEDIIIPENTTLNFNYYAILKESIGWIYTNYNNTYGWVYVYQREDQPYYKDIKNTTALKARAKDRILILSEDKVLYQKADINSKKIQKLKQNKEYKYKYSLDVNDDYFAYYIEDEDVKGWFLSEHQPYNEDSEYAIYSRSNMYVTNKEGIKVKDNYKDDDFSMTIPYQTTLKVNYYITYDSTQYYEVEYENKKYWLEFDHYSSEFEMSYYQYNIETKEEIKTYSELKNLDSETKITIPANTKLKSIHDYANFDNDYDLKYWFYVEYEGKYYWIMDDNNMSYESTIFDEEQSEKKQVKEETKEEKLTPKQIGLICIGGAIVLALVTIVSIKLINKKKKEVE